MRSLPILLPAAIFALFPLLSQADDVRFTSNPSGARVEIVGTWKDGQLLRGQSDQHTKRMPTTFETPTTGKVDGQTDYYQVVFSKPGYFDEVRNVRVYGRKVIVDNQEVAAVHAELTLRYVDRTFTPRAETTNGQPIANVRYRIDGREVTEPPLALRFERAAPSDPFPTFQLSAEVPDFYQRSVQALTIDSPNLTVLTLSPVTEYEVVRYFPKVTVSADGPKVDIDLSTTIGLVDDQDAYSPASSLTKITNFQRGQVPLEAVNSFAITPDGQKLIYSVTSKSQRSNAYFANLYHRPTEPSGSVTPLTSGDLYLDCYPAFCREPESDLLVFQSNRISTDEFDISSLYLNKPRRITALTTQSGRFNIQPSFVAETKPIFFTSIQKLRSPQLAYVTTGSIAPTTLENVDGGMLNYAEDGRIYFASLNEATNRFQISSISDDGSERTSYLTEDRFLNSNCHSPSIATDLRRLLFVCDYSAGTDARPDNNIWLVDLEGNQPPQQLTFNASDDIQPRWSPTEPNVIFFLSNRGGVYNIWRMEL